MGFLPRPLGAVLLALAIAFPVTAAAEGGRVQTESYRGIPVGPFALCSLDLSVVCLDIRPGERRVSFEIRDDQMPAVTGYVFFPGSSAYGQGGIGPGEWGAFCGRASDIPIPADHMGRVVVYIGTIDGAPWDTAVNTLFGPSQWNARCPLVEQEVAGRSLFLNGWGTTGTITATFT